MEELTLKINGITLGLLELDIISGLGFVLFAKLLDLPDGSQMRSQDISDLLKGQQILGCEIKAVEMFALLHQRVGMSVGLKLGKQ